MFTRRTSRQGSGLSSEGVDWGVVEEVVKMVQNRQQVPKETFSTIKKGLKAGTQHAACNSLTLLDSIAMNGGQSIREQLADPIWIEMLLSACYKHPVAAAPLCQLLSNWICSYGQEKLGHAAQYAAQALRQKSFYIPVPTALAYHLAKLSQQRTPVIGFQQGTDFASVLGTSTSGIRSRSGSLSSRQGSATSSQLAQAMGGSMGQKVEAMQRGAQQLRELDQICQSIVDAGPAAAAGVDCKQHSQKGGQLASQCNGWANEVQVMVACEPSDQILAVLLETNDQLLSALTGWDATAQRLAMLQSQQPAAASNSNHASSSNPASATQMPSSAAAQLPSSTSNGSHDYPPAASTSAGGAFWDSLQAQADQLHGTQPQLQHRPPQLQSQDAAPQRAQGFASSSGRRGNDEQSENSVRQGTIASNSYLDELGGLPASQYPHQKLQSGGDTWQPFGAGPAQPSGPALASHRPQQASHSHTVNSGPKQQHAGYQGSVLSYALKEQPSQESNIVTDPFAGVEQRQYASPDSPFKAASASQSPFEALPPRQASLSGHSSSFTQQRQHTRMDTGLLPGPESLLSEQSSSFNQQQHTRMDTGMLPGPADSSHSTAGSMQPNTSFTSFDGLRSDASDHILAATSNQAQAFTGRPAGESQSLRRPASSSNGGAGTLSGADMMHSVSGNSLAPATSAAPSGMLHDNAALRSNSASSAEVATLRQQVEQLQAQQAQHEEEVEQMQQQHAAQMAAIQAQAVTKMKELIEKVKQQTVKERQQAELRLEEAHQAEANAVAQLQSLRKGCREKDATIADQQRRLSQQASAATSSPSHDLESTSRTKSSAALDSSPLQQHAFGGIPRPRSASSQLPALGGSVTRRPVQRAGSHLDKPSASSSVQAYYRQPALRVRFTPGQLEELTQHVSGVSHRDWSAQLKLPPLQ